MTDEEFKLYISELKNFCVFFEISVNGMKDTLQNSKNPANDDHFWYYAQNGISTVANISKLLWGSNNNECRQRQQFRNILKVNDDSSIKNKQLRNSLEHIDGKFNEIARNYPGIRIDRNIGDIQNIIVIDDERPDSNSILRSYNPETSEFTFMNRKFTFSDVLYEIKELKTNLNRLINSGEDYSSLISEG